MTQKPSLIPNLKTPEYRVTSIYNRDYQRLRILAIALSSKLDDLISSFQLATVCLNEGNQSEFDDQHKVHFQDGNQSFSQQLSDMSKRLALGETRANLIREPDLARWYGDAIMVARALGLWHAAIRDRASLPRSDEHGTMVQIMEKLDQVYGIAELDKIKGRIEILTQRALAQNAAGGKPSRGTKRVADQLPDDWEGKDDGSAPPARFRRTAGGRIAITSSPQGASSDTAGATPLPDQQGKDMAGITAHGVDAAAQEEGEGEEAEDEPTPKILSRACIERPFPFVINSPAGFQDAWKTVQVLENRVKRPEGADDRDLNFMNVLVRELCEYAMEATDKFNIAVSIRSRNLRYLQFCEAPQSEIQKAKDELKEVEEQHEHDGLGFGDVSEREGCIKSLFSLYGIAREDVTESANSK
ncbi:hypothetical protein MCOR27_001211 [Pyricularia oryzae]|nr:hypothetical protein MCOR01_008168 [Pyricularia oryzae]KAH9438756.1 hypothetical protein MCOR02_002359 [Pyricularia oryzae]KAI6270655.1 hypothetical protein MCOR26_008160 [Pyricularia oryzae]KAI6287847.1 hypothetical protein MCOR27_001211 [Pyricularia oryzae]KAI6310874.1 hypothetical protein MCOR34_006213 [Pyricularia oryzae]